MNEKIYCENILKNGTSEKQHTHIMEKTDKNSNKELKDVFLKK